VDQQAHDNRAGSGADPEKVENIVEKACTNLENNGIFFMYQLKELALHGTLNAVVDCVGVNDAITEEVDRKVAERRRQKKFTGFILSLSGNLESMESVCVNYGLVAALVLTMLFANFGSITKEDWDDYLRLALYARGCQALTDSTDQSLVHENHLGWEQVKCMEVLDTLIEDPNTDLTGTRMAACLPTIECAKNESWNIQLAFTVGNGGGSSMLLLVVLFTAWLFISLRATKVNRTRYAEAKLLCHALRMEFLVLHLMFVVGIILAFFGLMAVMTMKATTRGLSWTVWWINVAWAVLAFYILVKCVWEIYHVNKFVDELRERNTPLGRAEFVDKVSKKSGEELQSFIVDDLLSDSKVSVSNSEELVTA